MRRFLVLSIVLLLAGGCIRPRPNTRPQPAALDVPPPPARVIVPVEPDEEPADETPATQPEEKERRPTRPRPSTRVERPETAKPTDLKPEPPAAEAPRPPAATGTPLPSLQPVLPASPGEMEKRVRDQLAQASRDLQRIDYRVLSADGKSQYDTAKRFIEQAGQALTEKNLVFAARLAEKAVGLSTNLLPR